MTVPARLDVTMTSDVGLPQSTRAAARDTPFEAATKARVASVPADGATHVAALRQIGAQCYIQKRMFSHIVIVAVNCQMTDAQLFHKYNTLPSNELLTSILKSFLLFETASLP